jgi:hypothetical protein
MWCDRNQFQICNELCSTILLLALHYTVYRSKLGNIITADYFDSVYTFYAVTDFITTDFDRRSNGLIL